MAERVYDPRRRAPMTEYGLVVHRHLVRYSADVEGPAGPFCRIEGRLTLRGPDFVVRDAAGREALTVGRPRAFLTREVHRVLRDGAVEARVLLPAFSFAREYSVEVREGPPWRVRQDWATDQYAFERDGVPLALVSGRVLRRGLLRAEEYRIVDVEDAEDPLLVVTLAAILTRSM